MPYQLPVSGRVVPVSAHETAVQAAIDAAVAVLSEGVRIVGEWEARIAFPVTRPDTSPILQGDAWTVSRAGVFGGVVFDLGDRLIALKNAPSTVYGVDWIRAKSAVPNRTKVAKWLICADLQPEHDNAPQIAACRSVLDDMRDYHRDAQGLLIVGDLVDRASLKSTGAAPAYGFPELLTDIRIRNLPPLIAQSGNHDRDGTGAFQHERYWTYRTAREHIGPLYFPVMVGNVLRLFLGDMAGSTSGELTTAALDWLDQKLRANQGVNVEIYMHAPMTGAWIDPAGGTPAWAYQRQSARLAEIIAAHDNIAAVYYGHVGRSYALSTQVRVLHGTTHIGVQMGLERAERLENGGDDDWAWHYAVAYYTPGSPDVLVRRWDAKVHDWIDGDDIALTYKYPLETGVVVHDGRMAADRVDPHFDGSVRVTQDLGDSRYEVTPGVWATLPGVRYLMTLETTDTSVDDGLAGDGVGLLFRAGGSTVHYYAPDGVTEVTPPPSDPDDDDVIMVDTFGDLPATGEAGKWYLVVATTTYYQWDGDSYEVAAIGRYDTAEQGSGVVGAIAAVRESSVDDSFLGSLVLMAATAGLGADSLVPVLAAHSDLTTSLIGGLRPVVLTSGDDLNALLTTAPTSRVQFVQWTGTGPTNSTGSDGYLLHFQSSATRAFQIEVLATGTVKLRRYNPSAWTGWSSFTLT